MSVNVFRKWLKKNDNGHLWKQPMPSEQFDKLVSRPEIQRSIAKSKRNQHVYSYIENKITTDYAWLIDYKLREALKGLHLDDLRDPSGFESKSKSNDRQRNYFDLRDNLEHFLKHDIKQHHDNPDAELNAFRRWVEVSDLLLKRHCYEGFLLVFFNTYLLAKPHLVSGLPTGLRQRYYYLCHLGDTGCNHAPLRHYIHHNKKEHDFPPLIFNYHAIAVLNESIEQLEEKEINLKQNRRNLCHKITKLDQHYRPENYDEIVQASLELLAIPEQIRIIQFNVKDQFEQRARLIHEISGAQKASINKLPVYLEASYDQMKALHKDKPLELPAKSSTRPATLYSHKLLPGFWNRNCSTSEKYWKNIFSSSTRLSS